MSNNRRSSITLVPIAGIWVPLQPIANEPSHPDEPGRPPRDFPENAIQVLPDFFPDGLSDLVDGVIAGLKASTHVIRPLSHGAGVVINEARTRLATLLRSRAFTEVRSLLVREDGTGIVDGLSSRDYGVAEANLDVLDAIDAGSLVAIGESTIATALTREPVTYFATSGNNPSEPDAGAQATLPGYAGPALAAAQRSALSVLTELAAGGPERDFRLPVLRAECLLGQRDYADALKKYKGLLTTTTLSADRRKFVAIRAALAHVALGDQLFREERDLTSAERAAVLAEYDAAIAVLGAHRVASANPLRQHIENRATAQKLSVEAGFNALGFKDGYVPLLRPEFLLDKAQTRIDLAIAARDKFVNFRQQADQLDDEAARLLLERDVTDISAEIATERRAIAGEQTALATRRREDIEAARSGLLVDTVLSATPGVLAAMAGVYFTPTKLPAGLIQSGKGLASAAVEYRARQNDLENQLELARIEEEIAGREERIAELEEAITAVRSDGLREQLDRLGNRFLNADLLYALSGLYEDMAERSLVAAIRWAYLYERAVAFRRLKPNLKTVEFDYHKQLADTNTMIPAPDLLLEALTLVEEQDVPSDPGQLLPENPISLRTNYPIEFNRFLQTGEMDFVISLYDLEKLRPGVYHRRLGQVRVQVRGLIPATGFAGHIIHRGFFTLRDKVTTLGPPPATRLMPTADEMRTALANLQAGNIQGDSVGGVLVYLLDDDPEGQGQRQELSAVDVPGDNNPEASALALFEGYGETGRWHLEINGIDPRLITDVLIGFSISFPQPSGALEGRIEQLIAEYERDPDTAEDLDKIAVFSLRGQFPDAFDALVTGAGTFVLDDTDFPTDITDLRVKAIVGQVVDDDGTGVEGVTVRFRGVGTAYDETRTSGELGFTEVMDEEIPLVQPPSARVPAPGTWQVRLTDRADFTRLHDLRLFIIYSFRSAN